MRKKEILLMVTAIVTLLLVVLGATYAYFQVTVNNSSYNKTELEGGIESNSLVTLKGITSKLQIVLDPNDMAPSKETTEYYGDDTSNFVTNETAGLHTISEVSLKGENEKLIYSCTATLVIKMDIGENDMGSVLMPGDVMLHLEHDSLIADLDLSNLKNTGTTDYDISFDITKDKKEEIKAYMKLVNQGSIQNYLEGKTLSVNIETNNLDCNSTT